MNNTPYSRLFLLYLGMIFLQGRPVPALPRDQLSTGKSVSLAGKLDASAFPPRLKVNPGQKDQEFILIKGLEPDQVLHFDQLPVAVEGVLTQTKPLWTLTARSIRIASKGDISQVILKNLGK